MAGIEPASGRLTGVCPYQHRPHRIEISQDGGIRTRALRFPKPAEFQLSYILRFLHKKRPAGVEPALPPWQGSRLPLHHGRVVWSNCQRTRAMGGTRTHVPADQPSVGARSAESSPLDHPCISSVGSEGLEPSPTWLRARHAAASTLIPLFHLGSQISNLNFQICDHGVEGSRTLAWPLKRRLRCRYATTPKFGSGRAFQAKRVNRGRHGRAPRFQDRKSS